MIVDGIGNASLYYGIGSGVETALRYLQNTDFSSIAAGRHELDGGCYAMVQDYTTNPREQKRWEAHRAYIDVQFIASGKESIGYAGTCDLDVVESYDAANDIEWFEGSGSFVTAAEGTFVLLFPHDAHMPGVHADGPGNVRKVVVKVPVE